MAADFGPRGIRVNAISPGEIDTAILSPGTDKIVHEQIPLRRLGEPEEVAKAIYFLCTDQSSYVQRRRAAHRRRPARLRAAGALGSLAAAPARQLYTRSRRSAFRAGVGTSVGRSVAQPGSALASGARGREFESPRSDQHLARK